MNFHIQYSDDTDKFEFKGEFTTDELVKYRLQHFEPLLSQKPRPSEMLVVIHNLFAAQERK